MYHTIFVFDDEINTNKIFKGGDSYYKLCLLKLNFIKIISFQDLEDRYFNCKNLLISCYKDLLKFNDFIMNNNKLNLIKNVNIFLFRMGSIHESCIDLKFKYNIISTYSYALNIYFNNYNNNYWVPYMLRYNVKYNNNPINKVLVTGAKNKKVYPNRHIMMEKSLINSNIIYTKRPYLFDANNIDENNLFGINYIKLLSNYLICFTDESNDNRPYLVAKFFEIMSSGALLLTTNKITKKYFQKLGFIDGIHYISTTIEDIDEKIDYLLNEKNRKLIDEIRTNGYNEVYKYHTIEHRTKQLDDILNNRTEKFTLYDDGIRDTKYYMYKRTK
mgnify:CR=1 FL=1